MMSTWGEKYKDRFSGITPPLASIIWDGNSCFSALAAECNSCKLEGWRTEWEEIWQWKWAMNQAWITLYLGTKVVQHYYICSCFCCLSGFLSRATLYINLTTETTHWAGGFYSLNKPKQGFIFWVSSHSVKLFCHKFQFGNDNHYHGCT